MRYHNATCYCSTDKVQAQHRWLCGTWLGWIMWPIAIGFAPLLFGLSFLLLLSDRTMCLKCGATLEGNQVHERINKSDVKWDQGETS